MFGSKSSNLLFLTNPKHVKIRDDEQGFRTSRSARRASVEQILRRMKSNQQILVPIPTETAPQTAREHKSPELQRLNTVIHVKENRINQQRKELQVRCKQVDSILRKLITTDNEPQLMPEVKLYSPYFRQEGKLAKHKKNTIYDPLKYINFYDDCLQKNVKFSHQVSRALTDFRKQLQAKQQRVPNFIKNL